MTFTQAIDRANLASQQLHVDMEMHFDEMREAVSSYLTVISEDTLRKLLLAIEAVERRRDDAGNAACDPGRNGGTGGGSIVSSPAAVDFPKLGAQLSRCASISDQAIRSVVDSFYKSLEAPQNVSLSLLSLVLDYVSRSNPVNAPKAMSREILRTVSELRTAHETITVPELERRLAVVKAAVLSVPVQTSDCVAPVLEAVRC